MSCYLEDEKGDRLAVLSFQRDALLYDIRNYAYIEGHIMETENVHARHMVQDVGDEGNVDRMTRVLDLSVARCKEMLYSYTHCVIERPELTDCLKERAAYGIVMRVPEDMSQTTLDLLERSIHEYLVSRSVADWLSITYPAKMETWLVKASEAEATIRSCVLKRRSRVRRRCHPF